MSERGIAGHQEMELRAGQTRVIILSKVENKREGMGPDSFRAYEGR
jgi:hypothetical protein